LLVKLTFKTLFRIAVFSTKVLKDERIVIVAEQRPDASEEEVFSKIRLILIFENFS
jgi:hypothetical protein